MKDQFAVESKMNEMGKRHMTLIEQLGKLAAENSMLPATIDSQNKAFGIKPPGE